MAPRTRGWAEQLLYDRLGGILPYCDEEEEAGGGGSGSGGMSMAEVADKLLGSGSEEGDEGPGSPGDVEQAYQDAQAEKEKGGERRYDPRGGGRQAKDWKPGGGDDPYRKGLRTITHSDGRTVQTHMSDDEALKVALGKNPYSKFLRSVNEQYQKRGTLSPSQWYGVHKTALSSGRWGQ